PGVLMSPTRSFLTIDREALSAVTGGLSSTIRARPRSKPAEPAGASSGVETKLAGLMSSLQGVGQPQAQAQAPAPAPSPFGGLPLGQLLGGGAAG
ncbi:MAG: hypothetical protein KBG48_35250, partial [Kofleriaceae bacterium]|nr:hypothetical protein [Kofleriaceae bacterium]